MPPSTAVAPRVVAILSQPELEKDRWLPLAATSAAARNDADFLDVVRAGNGRRSESAPLIATVRVVAEHFARGKPGVAVTTLLVHQLPRQTTDRRDCRRGVGRRLARRRTAAGG